jgi:hypothetical protein
MNTINAMYQLDSNQIVLKRNGNVLRLRKSLFWDLPADQIHPERNKRLIMERVFTRGNMKEFKNLRDLYSRNEIMETVVQIGSLDKKTMVFLSKSYQIPLTKFKCFT